MQNQESNKNQGSEREKLFLQGDMIPRQQPSLLRSQSLFPTDLSWLRAVQGCGSEWRAWMLVCQRVLHCIKKAIRFL